MTTATVTNFKFVLKYVRYYNEITASNIKFNVTVPTQNMIKAFKPYNARGDWARKCEKNGEHYKISS